MKVLIIGGTGFISGAIAQQAQAAGHDVTLFTRGARDLYAPYPMIIGDVADLATLHAHDLRRGGFDVVVHCIANTAKHGADLATVFDRNRMAPYRSPQIIALSSIDCYQAFWDMQAGKNPARAIDERAPLCRKKHYWRHMPGREDYDKNLMTQEIVKANLAGAVNATVFRVPLVYGPNDRQYAHRHGAIIRHLLEGRTVISMTAAEQQDVMPYAYVDNIAAAVVHSFGKIKTYGGIYNLADPEVMPRHIWAQAFAAVAGRALKIRTLRDADNRAPRQLIIDASRFTRHTGFVAPVDLTMAVCLTYAWAQANPQALADVSMPSQRSGRKAPGPRPKN